jgi:hypothetical protein
MLSATAQANWSALSVWSSASLIAGVMLLTIFEGALRKWVFDSSDMLRYATYFSKDILFVVAGYLGWQRRPICDLSWLAICAAMIILPSAGPTMASLSPIGVLLSVRAYLIIPICAYLAASLIRGFADIERCALVVAIASIGVAALGLLQTRLSPNHFLNRYDTGTEGSSVVFKLGQVRAVGTFAYITGMGMMAGAAAWAGAVLALPTPGRRPWIQAIGMGGIAAGFVCSATSMSRTGLLLWGFTVVGACVLYFRPGQVLGLALAAMLAIPFLGGDDGGGEDFGGRKEKSLTSGLMTRLEEGNVFSDRANYVWTNLILGLTNDPLGAGLGQGQQGAGATARNRGGYESEFGRIAFEIGPIGLLAVLFMRLSTCRRLWQGLSRELDNSTRIVVAASIPYFVAMVFVGMAFNHTGSSFAWAIACLGLAAAYGYGRVGQPAMPAVAGPRYQSVPVR